MNMFSGTRDWLYVASEDREAGLLEALLLDDEKSSNVSRSSDWNLAASLMNGELIKMVDGKDVSPCMREWLKMVMSGDDAAMRLTANPPIKKGRAADHDRNLAIRIFLRKRLIPGCKREAVYQDTMDKFGITRRRVLQIVKQNDLGEIN
jgi:hypothetical protein